MKISCDLNKCRCAGGRRRERRASAKAGDAGVFYTDERAVIPAFLYFFYTAPP